MRARLLAAPTALLAVLALAPAASADKTAKSSKDSTEAKADSEKSDGASDDDAKPKKKKATPLAGDEAADDKSGKDDADDADAKPKAPEEKLAPNDAKELPGKTYYFLGARARFTRLPQFLLNLFVAGGPPGVWIPSYGIEGTMRRDAFDTTLHLSYADWSMTEGKPFAFKGKDEVNTAWEMVTSNLKLVTIGVDLLWGTDSDKHFQFQYGMTTGLAFVLGDLKRVQGQPKPGGNPDSPGDIVPCPGPIPGNSFCTSDNDHYGNYTEKSWFDGGKRPNIYASFGPQIGMRFKPGKPFMARVNVGWDIFQGPFFGLNGSYGL